MADLISAKRRETVDGGGSKQADDSGDRRGTAEDSSDRRTNRRSEVPKSSGDRTIGTGDATNMRCDETGVRRNVRRSWRSDRDEYQQSHSHSVDTMRDMHDANEVRNDVHFQDDRRAINKEFERKLNNVEIVVNTIKLLSIINIMFSGVAMFVTIMKNN
ncbi:hypothetical protein EZV62_024341 [Acer yangbiense]|uniref:Uncharacterized protein n=1 Tax=Acer yangbiense TaxID=1000413 RepID=A0A5C7H4E9_9ROSI|nr:hypothetical protein EZV62_024341 [Acer yangbiense]